LPWGKPSSKLSIKSIVEREVSDKGNYHPGTEEHQFTPMGGVYSSPLTAMTFGPTVSAFGKVMVKIPS